MQHWKSSCGRCRKRNAKKRLPITANMRKKAVSWMRNNCGSILARRRCWQPVFWKMRRANAHRTRRKGRSGRACGLLRCWPALWLPLWCWESDCSNFFVLKRRQNLLCPPNPRCQAMPEQTNRMMRPIRWMRRKPTGNCRIVTTERWSPSLTFPSMWFRQRSGWKSEIPMRCAIHCSRTRR